MSTSPVLRTATVLLLNCTGCGREQTTGPALHRSADLTGLATEYARYQAPTLGHPIVVRVRVANQTGGTLYLRHCGPVEVAARLEQETDSGWVWLPTGECPLVLYTPVAIAPGETRLIERTLHAVIVPPGVRLHGRFRIVLPIARTRDDAPDSPDLIPLAERTSQVFAIE